jgi:hypothetical protein
MKQKPFDKLLEHLRPQATAKLLELLKGKVNANENGEEVKAIQQVLQERQVRFPDLSKTPCPPAKPTETRALAADSNAWVSNLSPEKIELSFPEQGFIRCGRSEFKSQADLAAYIAEVFSLPDKHSSTHLSVRRRGKYQRMNHTGRPIYTFGDPLLDLMTDEHGWITVGNETYNLLQADLASPQDRKGGITPIDLSVNYEEIRQQHLAEALSTNGTRTLVEHNQNQLITSIPSEINFAKNGGWMRFRSWKKNYGVYRSIGTEIETWYSNFVWAEIQSTYADPVLPQNPFICHIVRIDSDHDTNDDYVDEYEYAWLASIPSTVRSFCQALWKGQVYGGTVSKGSCQTFL